MQLATFHGVSSSPQSPSSCVSVWAGAALAHAHVQRRLAPERKTPFHGVEMVRRDSQVGQYAVCLGHPAQPEGSAQEPKIAFDVVEPSVGGGVGERVAILVEGIEPPFGPPFFEDTARVAAPAESEVDIGACGVDAEQTDGLFQKHRCMVLRHIRCR